MQVIDSHTAGEPTRVIINGGPDLGAGTLAERAARLEPEHKAFCRSVLLEPRGHEAMVAALLVEPCQQDCAAGVIFFNPLQNLGMCGHAAIGTVITLAHLKRIEPGIHKLETPVGVVEVNLHDANTASVINVESYRLHKGLKINVRGYGTFTGDVAWGGNWFFLVQDCTLALTTANIRPLTDLALAIRNALGEAGITGVDGAWIDHIEFFGAPQSASADSRNFVLCPGGAYDRSPCGTGSSAKLACLAADGLLAPEKLWIQESIIGSRYELSYEPGNKGGVIPTVKGQAFVTSEANLLFDPDDPYRIGLGA